MRHTIYKALQHQSYFAILILFPERHRVSKIKPADVWPIRSLSLIFQCVVLSVSLTPLDNTERRGDCLTVAMRAYLQLATCGQPSMNAVRGTFALAVACPSFLLHQRVAVVNAHQVCASLTPARPSRKPFGYDGVRLATESAAIRTNLVNNNGHPRTPFGLQLPYSDSLPHCPTSETLAWLATGTGCKRCVILTLLRRGA